METLSLVVSALLFMLIAWGAWLCTARTDRRQAERRAGTRGGRRATDIRAVSTPPRPTPSVEDWKKRRAA